MEDINLHFTGDFHAITSAHNLLVGAARQPHLLGQRAGLRRAPHRLAPRARHERPRAALDRQLAGRHRQRLPARGRLRHHGGLRGDGDPLPRHGPQGPGAPARQHRDRLHARPQADPGARHQGRRRHDRAPQGRADAEPGADAGEQPGLHPRRSVRQHRARLQLGARHQDRAQAVRLRGDGGRLRRRPGGREVLRHQVPQGRPQPGRGRDRGHRARAQDARRRGQGRPQERERRGRRQGLREPRSATWRTCASSACRRWWPSTSSSPTPTRRSPR